MIHCDVVFIIRAFETVYCVSVYVCAKENACIENLYEKYLLLSKHTLSFSLMIEILTRMLGNIFFQIIIAEETRQSISARTTII